MIISAEFFRDHHGCIDRPWPESNCPTPLGVKVARVFFSSDRSGIDETGEFLEQ